jgi:hypothetical protein
MRLTGTIYGDSKSNTRDPLYTLASWGGTILDYKIEKTTLKIEMPFDCREVLTKRMYYCSHSLRNYLPAELTLNIKDYSGMPDKKVYPKNVSTSYVDTVISFMTKPPTKVTLEEDGISFLLPPGSIGLEVGVMAFFFKEFYSLWGDKRPPRNLEELLKRMYITEEDIIKFSTLFPLFYYYESGNHLLDLHPELDKLCSGIHNALSSHVSETTDIPKIQLNLAKYKGLNLAKTPYRGKFFYNGGIVSPFTMESLSQYLFPSKKKEAIIW